MKHSALLRYVKAASRGFARASVITTLSSARRLGMRDYIKQNTSIRANCIRKVGRHNTTYSRSCACIWTAVCSSAVCLQSFSQPLT